MSGKTLWKEQLYFSVGGEIITRRKAIISHLFFTAITFLNYADRFTIAGILSDVEEYFEINETQKGLIQALFILIYMMFAPLCGYLGDRFNRKYILIFAVLLWSFFTLCGSFVGAGSFWLFLIFRGLVGIGESSYMTVSPSMIGELIQFVKSFFVKTRWSYSRKHAILDSAAMKIILCVTNCHKFYGAKERQFLVVLLSLPLFIL